MEKNLSWNQYFMGIAFLSSKRSKDPRTKVGSCIVNKENKIIGIGYNGMPCGCDDAEFPWGHEGELLSTKYPYVVHAELNAILNSNSNLKDCTIFTTLFPCNECCKAIIQSGIKKIIYLSDKYKSTDAILAAKRMLDSAKVSYETFDETISIELDLNNTAV